MVNTMIRTVLATIIITSALSLFGAFDLPGWAVSGMVGFSTAAFIRATGRRRPTQKNADTAKPLAPTQGTVSVKRKAKGQGAVKSVVVVKGNGNVVLSQASNGDLTGRWDGA